jgi:biotin synthase-related radical SAM superfamily protein
VEWTALKARLLSLGRVRFTGDIPAEYISRSAAGPGAGGPGSVFFSAGGVGRVRLEIGTGGPVELRYSGGGNAVLYLENEAIEGRLAEVPFHCPRQAYITVSSGCIFSCRYCNVPALPRKRKTIGEIVRMVEEVRDQIDAISITSGVYQDPAEEDQYVCQIIRELTRFGIPIGVSIYPVDGTPDRLFALGVAEVKFNIEAATDQLFSRVCPGLDREGIWIALRKSVELFGRGRVFSNLIIGLGETDPDLEDCIQSLTRIGVIPVIRPLNPVQSFAGAGRPTPERLLKIALIQKETLDDAGLDPTGALTMCPACTGCDLTPGRDL